MCAQAGHAAHLEGADSSTLWGLLGTSEPRPAPAASALIPLPPLPTPDLTERMMMSPPANAPVTPAPSARRDGTPAASAADAALKAKEEKLARMKKLLAAAEQRLSQAQMALQERDDKIAALQARG